MILTTNDAKNLYEAFDRAIKIATMQKESDPSEAKRFNTEIAAFKLSKKYVEIWLGYNPKTETTSRNHMPDADLSNNNLKTA